MKDTPGYGEVGRKPKIPGAIKRPTKKKPKDKPRRPLSAYNYFFKEEREKIRRIVLADDPMKIQTDPYSDDYLDETAIGKLRKEDGKVSFSETGKLIGQRWKIIHPDRLEKYAELAAKDTERYKKEMESYNVRQEAKLRQEALKPPVPTTVYPGHVDVLPNVGMPPMGAGGEPPRPMYPGEAAAYGHHGNPAAMGGGYSPYDMQYYGMAAPSMYGAYAGYPPMGGGPEQPPPPQSAQMSGPPPPGSHEASHGDPYAAQSSMGAYGQHHMGMMPGGGYHQGGSMMGYGGAEQAPYPPQYPPDQGGAMYGGYGGSQGWGGQ